MVEPLLAKVVAVCVWSRESSRIQPGQVHHCAVPGHSVRQDGVQPKDAETGTRYEIRRPFAIAASRAPCYLAPPNHPPSPLAQAVLALGI